MAAMEKAAWVELLVSVTALVVAAALYPWLGNGASGAFGLLGFLVCGAWILRGQHKSTLVDERDRSIERKATYFGVVAAWMFLFLALAAKVVWRSYHGQSTVALGLINWLVWLQLVICYAFKGGFAIAAYRRQQSAA